MISSEHARVLSKELGRCFMEMYSDFKQLAQSSEVAEILRHVFLRKMYAGLRDSLELREAGLQSEGRCWVAVLSPGDPHGVPSSEIVTLPVLEIEENPDAFFGRDENGVILTEEGRDYAMTLMEVMVEVASEGGGWCDCPSCRSHWYPENRPNGSITTLSAARSRRVGSTRHNRSGRGVRCRRS